jgi:hypothetical protein
MEVKKIVDRYNELTFFANEFKKATEFIGFPMPNLTKRFYKKAFQKFRRWVFLNNELMDHIGIGVYGDWCAIQKLKEDANLFYFIIGLDTKKKPGEPFEHFLCPSNEIQNEVAKYRQLLELKANSFYVCLRFKESIKEYFYAGEFNICPNNITVNEANELDTDLSFNRDKFFPTLTAKIEELIAPNAKPTDIFINDFWEVGNGEVGFYWHIHHDHFEAFIMRFRVWIWKENLNDEFLYYSFNDNYYNWAWKFDLNGEFLD